MVFFAISSIRSANNALHNHHKPVLNHQFQVLLPAIHHDDDVS